MADDDVVVSDDGGGDDIGVIVLMLGLYLIVLAFFILLNAISEDSPDRPTKPLDYICKKHLEVDPPEIDQNV